MEQSPNRFPPNAQPLPDPRAARIVPPEPPSLVSPIALYGRASLQSGDQQAVNVKALRNNTPYVIEILEAHFVGEWPLTSGSGGGLAVSAKITRPKGAPIDVTKGYVPIWLLGKQYDNFAGDGIGLNPIYQSIVASRYMWSFAYPLRLGPGETLDTSFHHKGLISGGCVAHVSYLGRVLKNVRKLNGPRQVPWAAGYVSKAFDMLSNTADSDTSTEQDLLNPHSVPLELQYLTGWVGVASDDAAYPNADFLAAEVYYDALRVRLSDSDGHELIRDPTPFRLAFGAPYHEWSVRGLLPPGGHMIATVDRVVTDLTYSYSQTYLQAQAHIGLVGTREVRD